MGLLTTVLTLPVSGPVKGVWWVMNQVVAGAEAELYDEERIVAQLAQLADQVELGHISEGEHAAIEETLLERLAEARSRSGQTP